MPKLVRFYWAMKYLLRNKANFDILEGFLSELLKTQIKIESVLESGSNKQHSEDKFNRVDLLVNTAEGKHIIIEVQCFSEWDYLRRILYGSSKILCEHLREGDEYGAMPKVISVSIVFFTTILGRCRSSHRTALKRHYGLETKMILLEVQCRLNAPCISRLPRFHSTVWRIRSIRQPCGVRTKPWV